MTVTFNNFKDFSKFTKITRIFLYVQIAFFVCGILAGISQIFIEYFGIKETNPFFIVNNLTMFLASLLQFVTFLIGGTVFLVWTYKACCNANILSFEKMKFSPGGAVGWYFIPFFNLWKPFQAMKEIWEVSFKSSRWIEEPSSYINHWWFLWIVASFTAHLDFNLSNQNIQLDSEYGFLFVDILSIAINIIVIKLIMNIHNMQESSIECITGAPPLKTGIKI